MNSKNRLKTTSSIVSTALFTLGLAGCGSTPPSAVAPLSAQASNELASQPASLQPLYQALYQQGQQNLVLNRLEIGSQALYQGDIDQARTSFDEALSYIESTFANNENALKARSLWHEEGRKDYRGEAYERAMAYYYRGLVYLIDSEFDNARASFTSALMQDAFAEEQHDRADFGLMMFLIAWSSQQMGSQSLADEAWAELKTVRPDFVVPPADDNVLIISETGASPRKLADGVGHYELVYRRGKNFTEQYASVEHAGQQQPLIPLESIYLQAITRGKRDMDQILAEKAEFRNFNEQMGSTLAELGTTSRVFSPALGGDSGQIGTALSLIGVTQLMLASNTKPRADTRYWTRLPDAVHVLSMKLPAEQVGDAADWVFHYRDEQQQAVPSVTGQTLVFKGKNGHVLVWNKSRNL